MVRYCHFVTFNEMRTAPFQSETLMRINKFYRKEMEICRSLAKVYDRIPHWVIAAVYGAIISWEVFWYA